MNPYFTTPERLAALQTAAESWVGTPFQQNCQIRQVGASCHFACAGVYLDAGWGNHLGQLPFGDPGWGVANTQSQIEPWLDGPGSTFFESVPLTQLAPGDLLGFQVNACLDHTAILLPNSRIFHTLLSTGARIRPLRCIQQYLRRAWRPQTP